MSLDKRYECVHSKLMTYTPRAPKYDWRRYLTVEERYRVEQFELVVQRGGKLTAANKLEQMGIRNRAVQRAIRAKED